MTEVRGLGGIGLLGIALLVGVVQPPPARAQGMPFHTPTALPLPLAESGVRSSYRHIEMASLLDNGRQVANAQRLRVGANAIPVTIPHGIMRRTVLIVGIPYVWKTFDAAGNRETNSGLGDAFVMVKRELLDADPVAGNRRLAIFAGATFPTARTENAAGPLPPPLRLGSGIVSLTGQMVYSLVDDRFGAHGAVAYTAAAGSENSVRPGDRFGYDLALGYRLFPRVYQSLHDVTLAGYLELNGSIERPATQSGARLADTGGHTLFLSPGLQLIPLPNWAIEASVQYPLLRELRGVQLGPDWTVALGVRTVFYLLGG